MASTGTVLAAQRAQLHVHVKIEEEERNSKAAGISQSNPNTVAREAHTYNKKQGRQLQDKDVI
jgi:hypothetical protein